MVAAAPSGLVLIKIVATEAAVVLHAEGASTTAACPLCGGISSRVHARYRRHPLDLPWRGATVRLVVTVRRFRCDNEACARRTFAEDLGGVLPLGARRTVELTAYLAALVQAAGGEAGARLAREAGIPVSPDTLLRIQRTAPLPAEAGQTPRILGVDDLALRRGYRYATLLVNMETHRPVDLLLGREAEPLAAWLREHPGIEVIVRDRSGAYAEGARDGSPSAVQVADRFHLMQNATEAFDQLLRIQHLTTALAEAQEPQAQPPAPALAEGTPGQPPAPPSPAQQHDAARRAARIVRWEDVHRRRAAGESMRGIAQALGINRRTVRRLLTIPEAPLRRLQARPCGLSSPTLQPFVAHLQDRWQAGVTNISQLFREIQARGYPGAYSLLFQALRPWREARPPKADRRRQRRRQTRRSIRWLCIRPREHLATAEQRDLDHLLANHADLATGHALLARFRELVRDRRADDLENWLRDAQASGLPSFLSLAQGLRDDRAAVDAALTMPWSQGPVEGWNHKIKLIKRQGYGRASFAVLRQRVLAAC